VFSTPKSLFRTLAIAEVISWTLLITALILRATTGWALGVTIGGGIHGFIFLSYGATALLVAVHQRWSVGVAVAAIVAAIVPYATLPVEIWLQRSGRLEGAWRLDAGDDPRDSRWIDRLMRWFLRRPWVLALIILGAVVLLFVVLLTIGPPGGKS
jgi:integral membrane protein